jgi:serine/threonine protein kinase/ABC-type sugar transport system substrate-binding protein
VAPRRWGNKGSRCFAITFEGTVPGILTRMAVDICPRCKKPKDLGHACTDFEISPPWLKPPAGQEVDVDMSDLEPDQPAPEATEAQPGDRGLHEFDERPATALVTGTLVGEYKVQKLIKAGGMGNVYLAVQPLIGKQVAVKVIGTRFTRNPDAMKRFILEARSVNEIHHPTLVDIFSFGQLRDGRYYYVMEFLHGESLGEKLRRDGPYFSREAIPIFIDILSGLAAVHSMGIVHRDLKGDNVFLATQKGTETIRVKLLDFGLAKLLKGTAGPVTMPGTAMGTPHYMAPEQWRGGKIDPRADLYAVGVLIYEALTGDYPFSGESFVEVAQHHLTSVPRPAIEQSPQTVTPAVNRIVMNLLAKDPADRPASAAVVIEQLTAALRSCPPVPARTVRVVPPEPTPDMDPAMSHTVPADDLLVLDPDGTDAEKSSEGLKGLFQGVDVDLAGVDLTEFDRSNTSQLSRSEVVFGDRPRSAAGTMSPLARTMPQEQARGMAHADPDGPMRIGLFLRSAGNDYQERLKEDALSVALQHGCELEIFAAENDWERQRSQITGALARTGEAALGALLVSPVQDTALEDLARKAAEAGIGFVLLNRTTEYLGELRDQHPSARIFSVTPDQEQIGSIQASQIKALVKGGQILVITGLATTSSAQRRLQALTTGLHGPEKTPLFTVTPIEADWSTEGARMALERWLKAMRKDAPPPSLVAAQNDEMAIGAHQALQAAAAGGSPALRDLPIIGVDGSPSLGQKLVRERVLAATVTVPSASGPAIEWLVRSRSEAAQDPPVDVTLPVNSIPALSVLRRPRPPRE